MNKMSSLTFLVLASVVSGTMGQMNAFQYEGRPLTDPTMVVQQAQVPDCPLEVHPDTETMFIMRGPLGDPEPRTCPPRTYFMKSVCSCVNVPLDKCNLRPSALGAGWYEENVYGTWIQRPCGPGSAFNPSTCDCSLTF